MPTVSSVLSDFYALSPIEQNTVKSALINSTIGGTNIREYIENKRFEGGRVCPFCGSIHVVRNGKRKDGTQRYLCGDCLKSFVASSCSIATGTRKDLSVWIKYVECMLNGMSLNKTASACGIHKNTAFAWRHKILDVLQTMANSVVLDGIIEADETFFAVLYKGNHKRSSRFTMPRASHHHGHMTKIRGLSNEKVCVPCAVNRSGLSIAKVFNLARVKIKGLAGVFGGRIERGSVLVTDSASSYRQFATTNKLQLKQLKSGTYTTKGIYNIQHINNYHSRLKNFIKTFSSVSTKYLNNYLIWNNFVNYSNGDWDHKCNLLLSFVLSSVFVEYNRQIVDRDSLPIVA